MLYRKTSSKRFRRACHELAAWLKTVRSSAKVQEWWPILLTKLRGRLSRLPLEFGLRPGNRRQLYAAASCLSRSVAIALINCGS